MISRFANNNINIIRVVITACLIVVCFIRDAARTRSYSNTRELKCHTPSICRQLENNFFTTDAPTLWNTYSKEIIDASVSNATTWYQDEQNNNVKFKHWLDTLFEMHYKTDDMLKSSIRSPNLDATLKVLDIISSRVKYLDQGKKGKPSPSLHILVTGGSLTSGMACGTNHVGLPQPGWMNEYRICAWPSRLEALFNQVLFQGKEVVKVSNLAVGGANSEVGKTLLEYQLFADNIREQLPHIVIWAVSMKFTHSIMLCCTQEILHSFIFLIQSMLQMMYKKLTKCRCMKSTFRGMFVPPKIFKDVIRFYH